MRPAWKSLMPRGARRERLALLAAVALATAATGAWAAGGSPGSPAGPALGADGPTGGPGSSGGEDVVTVTGSGFGHGVGMSQYGALGMARDGASARKILTHFFSGTTVGSYHDNVDLRVNVVDRGTSVALRTAAIAAGGGAMQLVSGGGKVTSLPKASAVKVGIDGGSLSVTTTRPDGKSTSFTTGALTLRWSGARALPGPASALVVTSGSANASSTSSKERSYRYGVMRLVPVPRTDSDGEVRTRIEGIVVVNLHREYLRGIAEVPQAWPSAALQAQVIAARNYALTEYRAGITDVCGGCHLWDDARSQVYRGWGHEYVAPRWVAAVAATQTSRTSGLAVLYRGAPVRAYYSSSSGGRTRDAQAAWGRTFPYLLSVSDPWSANPDVNPRYARWERTVPRAKVATLFGLADVASIEITKRDRSGAAMTVTATSSDGTERALGGATLRSKLALPAPWYSEFSLP